MSRWLLLGGVGFALATAVGVGCEGGSDTAGSAAGGEGGSSVANTTSGGGFVPDCEPAPNPASDGSCVVLTTVTATTTSGAGGAGGAGGSATGGAGGAGGGVMPPVGVEVNCNPVAGTGCGDGEACDVLLVAGVQAGLRCAPPPNRAPLCAPCDPVSGPFCVPGSTCTDGTCRRFCCDDGDCPTDTTCSTQEGGTFRFAFASSLGICL